MGSRLRILIMLIGAALVVATFTYPLWRPDPMAGVEEAAVFPELNSVQLAGFQMLSIADQRLYLQMRDVNVIMAEDMVRARLRPDVTLPPEQQEPLSTEGAVVVATGEFAPVVIPEDAEELEREPSLFRALFNGTAGNVTVYQYADGSQFMHIDSLDVHRGPNLRVLLSSLPDPLNGDEILADNLRLDLGALPANTGNMNFPSVPVDVSAYASVVIFDSTYNEIFGVAELN